MLPEHFVSWPALFFFLTAIVWIYRARIALVTLARTPVLDPEYRYSGKSNALVSVMIPVKNEERNIRDCLLSLLNQDYPNLEIIVINDSSTDQTEAILKSLGARNLLTGHAQETPSKVPLLYFNAQATPPGWTGKNFALHSAIRYARGEWFLFTDADTRHESSSISAGISHAESRDLPFLSLLPRCLAEGFWENLIQPPAMGYLGAWFPPEKVNDPASKTYFANGQYLLIQRSLYEKIGGHEKVASEFLEDYGMMRHTKQRGIPVQCAFGTNVYGTRMYHSFCSIWQGWRRIYLHAFERKTRPLVLHALSIFLFSVVPFLYYPFLTRQTLLTGEDAFAWGMGTVILLFILGVSWRVYQMLKAKRLFAILQPLGSLFLAFILLDAARMAVFRKETKWR